MYMKKNVQVTLAACLSNKSLGYFVYCLYADTLSGDRTNEQQVIIPSKINTPDIGTGGFKRSSLQPTME